MRPSGRPKRYCSDDVPIVALAPSTAGTLSGPFLAATPLGVCFLKMSRDLLKNALEV